MTKIKRSVEHEEFLTKFVDDTVENLGCNINPVTGVYPDKRYYVAAVSKEIDYQEFQEQHVAEFIANNWPTLTKTGWHVGSVVEPNKVLLELVYNTDDFSNAVDTGMLMKQESIWDSEKGCEIELPKTFDIGVTLTQEYLTRMRFIQNHEIADTKRRKL